MTKVVWLGVLAVALGSAFAAADAPSTAAGSTAKSPTITFYLGLKRPEGSAVAAFCAVQQPGSPTYRRFLTPGQIGRLYGASVGTRMAFLCAIHRLGLLAQVDPSGVFARVRGTKLQMERAFRVRITRQFDNDSDSNSYFVAGGVLHLPKALERWYSRSSRISRPPWHLFASTPNQRYSQVSVRRGTTAHGPAAAGPRR